jgi:hypothetical protein
VHLLECCSRRERAVLEPMAVRRRCASDSTRDPRHRAGGRMDAFFERSTNCAAA